MATYKVTFFFGSATNQVGWTENWWTSAANPATAASQVNNYVAVRKACMLDNTAITQLRICAVGAPRDSYVLAVTTGTGTIASATYKPAGIWDCLLIRRDVATNDLLGHLFMHDIPENIFNGRVYNPSGGSGEGWSTAIAALETEVTNGTYLLRKKTAPNTYSYLPCTIFAPLRRVERKLGRPFDSLRGRRATA